MYCLFSAASDQAGWRRTINRLKQFRELVTRHGKRAVHYRTEIIVVVIVLWLRGDLQDTPWLYSAWTLVAELL